jgi:hypothetical protein
MNHAAEFTDAPLITKCGAASNGPPARVKINKIIAQANSSAQDYVR